MFSLGQDRAGQTMHGPEKEPKPAGGRAETPLPITCLARRRSRQSLRLHVHHREVPPEATKALGAHRVEVYPPFFAQEVSKHLMHHLNKQFDAQSDNRMSDGHNSCSAILRDGWRNEPEKHILTLLSSCARHDLYQFASAKPCEKKCSTRCNYDTLSRIGCVSIARLRPRPHTPPLPSKTWYRSPGRPACHEQVLGRSASCGASTRRKSLSPRL